jgi:hypothetical protein
VAPLDLVDARLRALPLPRLGTATELQRRDLVAVDHAHVLDHVAHRPALAGGHRPVHRPLGGEEESLALLMEEVEVAGCAQAGGVHRPMEPR